MKKYLLLIAFLPIFLFSQEGQKNFLDQNYIELTETIFKKAKVDYDAFETLVKEVKNHREEHLIDLKKFKELSKGNNTVILDTRSKEMYSQKHIKGAIHLNFSDFTQQSLKQLIPNTDTTILIYCNNNIENDEIYFLSKMVMPKLINKDIEVYTLALNIPTYINLYGYGYRNVYELSELVNTINLEFEGLSINKQKQ